MKKLTAKITLIVLLMFVLSCASSHYNLYIPEKEFIKSTKTVLIIPAYMSNEFFPVLPNSLKEIDFDEDHRKEYSSYAQKYKHIYDETVLSLFKTGKYKLNVVMMNTSDLKSLKINKTIDETYLNEEKTVLWPFNYSYSINKNDATSLAMKYNADAVLFHYLQVKKMKHCESGRYYSANRVTTWSYCLPLTQIVHSGTLFDKSGNILLDANSYGSSAYMLEYADVSGNKVRPKKYNIEKEREFRNDETKVRKSIDKQIFRSYHFLHTFEKQR